MSREQLIQELCDELSDGGIRQYPYWQTLLERAVDTLQGPAEQATCPQCLGAGSYAGVYSRHECECKQAPADPPCKTCNGTGMVDDGEIDCYPNGEPYENGPVKCVKDCPACAASRAQAAPQGTTSDQYRAELYDEVWEKARSMGYGNVTNALIELERMKAAPQPELTAEELDALFTPGNGNKARRRAEALGIELPLGIDSEGGSHD